MPASVSTVDSLGFGFIRCGTSGQGILSAVVHGRKEDGMKPILFDKSATDFTTQGLGRLSDAISCEVTEERNGSYELEMEYPIDGIHWKDVAVSCVILAKPNETSDPQAFRIYRISRPINKRCKVYAEHISYQLSYIPVMPYTADSFAAALSGLVTHAAENCPFTVWTDKTVEGSYSVTVPKSMRSLLGGEAGSVLDVYGKAEYEFDNYTIKAHLNRGNDNGVVLRYGKNITDLTQEENISDTITGICPYWKSNEDDSIVTLSDFVVWSDNASNYPYARTAVIDFSQDFDEEPTEDQLRARAKKYIEDNEIGVPEVNITLSFIPLWQSEEYKGLTNLEHVSLCDTVTVEFELLGVSAKAKVVKTTYDVLRERYESIEIGEPKTTLAKQIATIDNSVKTEVSETSSFLSGYITSATQKIIGGRGGYIKYHMNANGKPEELLVLSAESESESKSIIRMNKAGIGFSTDYGATYSSAWTIDGVFNADFIGAGSLDAGIITAGVLKDANGNTTFDLTTGVFTMTKGSITLGTISDGQYPFSVNDKGELVAVSATLVDATLSGTITTENGLYKSMLDSGYLRMFYDSTLYGQFGSGVWATNSAKRGLGMYISGDADYMFFGRYDSSSASYLPSYIINFGLSSEIGYSERHIFYSTSRFLESAAFAGGLTSAGTIYSNGLFYATKSVYLTASNLYFDNGYGPQFKDSGGTYRPSLYMSSSDTLMLASPDVEVQVYGKTTNIGSTSYPTVIDGSSVSIPKVVQSGTIHLVGSSGSATYEVTFDTSFPGTPDVLLTAVDPSQKVQWLSPSNITKNGFTINMSTGTVSYTNIYICWAAIYA